MSSKTLTYEEISVLLGVKAATLRAWVHRGKFPKPDAYAARNAAAWHEETVKAWLKSNS